jgi:hypothetical protein
MKTLTLWTFILILFTSCSTESETDDLSENQVNLANGALQRSTGLYPENSNNAYDSAGQLYYDISDSYYIQGKTSATTAGTIEQVEAIANLNEEFQTLRPSTYVSPTVARIDYILSNQQATALGIISNSSLSTKAKLSLTEFITNLMVYRNQQADYEVIYPFIIAYETATIADNGYTANDKKIILTTSSIARYEFYFAKKHRRKPRDRDWEISWGHIIAGTDGSEHSTANAIVMASVCNLIDNK